jgi:hypothetical protein
VHLFYLDLRLARSVKEVNDCYIQINIELKHDDLSTNERDRLLMEKEMHLDVAIGQHRMVSNFMREFIRHHAHDQHVLPTIILNHYDDKRCDDDGGDSDMTFSTVVPQI